MFREVQGAFHVYPETRKRVSEPARYRIPDVLVMALPYQPGGVLVRVADYLKFGVPPVWLPDPYRHKLQEADQEGIRNCPDLIVEADLVGQVDFAKLWWRRGAGTFACCVGIPADVPPIAGSQGRDYSVAQFREPR
jgi:hypothetical protein